MGIRLINADEVKRFYEEEFPDLDNGVHWSRNDIICNLDNIPTVKAIPIEWIEKQMAERENYGDFNTAGAIGYLLLSWEKENEIDKCG